MRYRVIITATTTKKYIVNDKDIDSEFLAGQHVQSLLESGELDIGKLTGESIDISDVEEIE